MSIEQRIAALMAESQEFAEATNEDAPKGLPKQGKALATEPTDLDAATKEENPDAACADVDTQDEGGTTSKDAGKVKGNASAPEASHLRKESVDDLVEDVQTFDHPEGVSDRFRIGHSTIKDSRKLSSGVKHNGNHYDDEIGFKTKSDRNSAAKAIRKHLGESIEESTYDSTEDVAALVEGEELSEEFKVKAATIFEAAVISRVKAEVSKLDEQYAESFQAQLEEAVTTEVEGLIEKVDGYLSYMAETWMKDNEIALDRGLKSEILESFVSSLKGVFEEHYIDVPESATDMVAEMEAKVAELAEKLNESELRNADMNKSIQEATRLGLIESKCSGLTDTDVEKFKGLAEELAFDTAETFGSKLQIIRESYFDKKTPAATGATFLNESETMIVEEKVLSPAMAAYTRALSKV